MTARAIQYRRGTTAEHSSFTGLAGEITVDTSKKVVIAHDGTTSGGFEMARADLNNVSAETITDKIGDISIDTSELADIDLSNLSATGTAVLSAKANTDASNFTATGKATIANWSMPDYVNGVEFRIQSTGWTALYDCFIIVPYGKTSWSSGSGIGLRVNGLNIDSTKIQANTSGTIELKGFVSIGDVITLVLNGENLDTINTSTSSKPMFYKLKGIS